MQLQQIFGINDKILQIYPGKNAVVFVIESKNNFYCLKMSPIRKEYVIESQIYSKLTSDNILSKYIVPFCGYGYISYKIIYTEQIPIFKDIKKFLLVWPNNIDFFWQLTKYDTNYLTLDIIEKENTVDSHKLVVLYRQHVLRYLDMYKKYKITHNDPHIGNILLKNDLSDFKIFDFDFASMEGQENDTLFESIPELCNYTHTRDKSIFLLCYSLIVLYNTFKKHLFYHFPLVSSYGLESLHQNIRVCNNISIGKYKYEGHLDFEPYDYTIISDEPELLMGETKSISQYIEPSIYDIGIIKYGQIKNCQYIVYGFAASLLYDLYSDDIMGFVNELYVQPPEIYNKKYDNKCNLCCNDSCFEKLKKFLRFN